MASLIIIFTFISLFLTEVITKTKIHPFQYTLIGGALVIYYTLLLSISEQFGYDIAYLIASVSTTVLLSLYAGVLVPKRLPHCLPSC
jgi:inner membrane protein